MYTVAIALGTNLGEREKQLAKAGKRLSKFLTQLVFSSIYETEPVGYLEQPWFLNQVCLGKTRKYPLELLSALKEIEKALGREPGPRFGPRTIDLDILFYDDWVIESSLLTIPHPRLEERSFVIQPLLELAPNWINPRNGEVLVEIWEEKKEELSQCYLKE